ncbi:unnamed protein product [Prorocentrum cordatum]|uniref:Uncharacterized protein n=1 Tax=Prorocentrum cordatum TaxID=2364126 RepID=A0ABN9PUY7_9DINO|nr:unnamed protein product [Polarella glacialis]
MSPNWGVSNAPPVMPLEVLRIRPRERACPFRSSLGGRGERVEHDEGRRQEAGGEGDDEEDSHHRTGKTEREQEQAWARGAPATRPLGPSPPGAASRRSLAARRGAVIGRKERGRRRRRTRKRRRNGNRNRRGRTQEKGSARTGWQRRR